MGRIGTVCYDFVSFVFKIVDWVQSNLLVAVPYDFVCFVLEIVNNHN